MNKYMLLYFIFIVYTTFTLGIYVKMRMKGVKKSVLIIALLFPALVVVTCYQNARENLHKDDVSGIDRIKLFFRHFFFYISSVPFMVSFVAEKLVVIDLEIAKKPSHAKKKRNQKTINNLTNMLSDDLKNYSHCAMRFVH